MARNTTSFQYEYGLTSIQTNKWTCSHLNFFPKFIRKYVDDFFAVLLSNMKEKFLETINQHRKDLKFTKEEPQNGILPYLDTKVMIKEGNLITDWYRKHTSQNKD